MGVGITPTPPKKEPFNTKSMKEKIIVNVSWCGKNFSASLSENVPGAVVFTAANFRELKKEARASLNFHLEGMEDDGDEVPAWWKNGQYEFIFRYSDFASELKAYSDIVSLNALAWVTGINPHLLSHYATGLKKPRQQQREKIINGLHTIGRELLAVV